MGECAGAQQLVTLDRHSRMAKNAVSVRASNVAGVFEVFDASGGDVFALNWSDTSSPRFALRSPPAVAATRGVVVDMARAEPFLYLAAFRGGVEIYDVSVHPPQPVCGDDPSAPQSCAASVAPCWLPPADHDVLSVAVALVEGRRIVLVGTEDRRASSFTAPTGGAVFVLEHDPLQQTLETLFELPLGRPVLCVAACEAFAASSSLSASDVTVLAGTHAGELGGVPAALQRIDFALAFGAGPTLCSLVAHQGWTTTGCGGAPKNMVVRDIAIDVSAQRAYVAAHWDGVWGFDLDPDALGAPSTPGGPPLLGLKVLPNTFEVSAGGRCELCPSDDWPLRVWERAGCEPSCDAGSPSVDCGGQSVRTASAYAACLALTPSGPVGADEQLLTIGWGSERLLAFNTAGQFSALTRERSYLRADGADDPANLDCGVLFRGLSVQRLVGGVPQRSSPGGPVTPLAQEALPTHPVALDAAFDAQGNFAAFVAEHLIATRAWRLVPASPGACAFAQQLEVDGMWGPGPPGRIPGLAVLGLEFASVEVAGVAREVLYAATESSLAAFWLDPQNARALSRPSTPSGPAYASNPLAPRIVSRAAIRLAGAFAQGLGAGARLAAVTDKGRASTNNSGGVRIFEVSIPDAPSSNSDLRTELSREGQGYSVALALELPRGAPPPPEQERRRLLVVPYRDGYPGRESGVKVWSLGTAVAPIDPQSAPSLPYGPSDNRVPLIGEFTPPNAAQLTLDAVGVLDAPAAQRQFVYVLYAPAIGVQGPLGVLALELRPLSVGAGRMRLTPLGAGAALGGTAWRGQYDADAICARTAQEFERDHYPSSLALDPAHARIFGAWAGVLAVFEYDTSGPRAFEPRLADVLDTTNSAAAYGMTMWFTSIALGPEQGGQQHLVCSLASDGLGLIAVGASGAPAAFGALRVFTLPWQSTWVEPDPRDPSRNTFFVAQGSAGFDWVRLCWPVGN